MPKPVGDCLKAEDWYVDGCHFAEARAFIAMHHYAGGGSLTGTHFHGLYRRGCTALSGVAWWLPPTKRAAESVWPEDPHAVLSLSRLAIAPDAPKNSATFLLGKSTKALGERWKCLLTYADTWRGHTGTIYKASGWEEMGLTKPHAIYTIGGKIVSVKTSSVTRSRKDMIASGATYEGSFPKYKFRKVRDLRGGVQTTMLEFLRRMELGECPTGRP